MRVVTPEQMRMIDNTCAKGYYIPGLLLMEHAGLGLFESVRNEDFNSVTIICGKGNNGGDGLACARHFINSGKDVVVFICAKDTSLTGDSKSFYDILCAMEADIIHLSSNNLDFLAERLKNSDILIDALFGTGLRGNLDGFYKDVIDVINEYSGKIISADIPSGVDGSSGKVLGTCVKADLTVTFGLPKVGNLIYPGRDYCGELIVWDIGIPENLLDGMKLDLYQIDDNDLKGFFKYRKSDTNKSTYGRVGIITGSEGMTGAGILASRAALRSGAGLVYTIVPDRLASTYECSLHESITIPIKESENFFTSASIDEVLEACEKMDSIVIGPGLGMEPETGLFVYEFIKAFSNLKDSDKKLLVIDADALNHISKHVYLLNELPHTPIITPHPGEMARLMWTSVKDIQNDRIGIAKRFSIEFNVVVVLKGAATITAIPDGRVFINSTGNPGMATAGSGDVLAGIIAAMCQNKYPINDQNSRVEYVFDSGIYRESTYDIGKSVACAVNIHGQCGDFAMVEFGEDGIIAGDLIDMLPRVFKKYK